MTDMKWCIGGNWRYRRYAYVKRSNQTRFGSFGLLEATSYENAKQHLGSTFRIKSVWITEDEHENSCDKDRVWEIVKSAFRISQTEE